MDEFLIALIIGAVALTFYFVPTLVGMARNTKRIGGIIVVNIFLGWTLLGWVGAFVWAVIEQKKE